MQKKGANISLSSYDDIFETDESRADSQLERVQKIPLRSLVPLKNHPFKVVDDEAMLRTTESIAQFGVLTPLIARPREDGTFEMQLRCLWSTVTCRGKTFCRVNGLLLSR